jgi:ubiquinone/menaquinone biosynthesis C-methylase UbiE
MAVLYNKIGVNYNSTRSADPFLLEQLIILLGPKPDATYLDIGCGTGNYTSELQKRGFSIIGIDPSAEMLATAKTQNMNIEWRLGTAEKTGLGTGSIDGIIVFLTIHHWLNLEQSFKELEKVLTTGGKIVLFTSTPKQMKGYWLNHYFPNMLEASIKQMPSIEEVKSAMNMAGLKFSGTKKYFIQPDLQDLFLYCGKNNPEIYLNAKVRNGISSFSSLANIREVKNGLKALSRDIESGEIDEVISNFNNDDGDYLFITGDKAK